MLTDKNKMPIKCLCGNEDVVGFVMHNKIDASLTMDMVSEWVFVCKRCLNGTN